ALALEGEGFTPVVSANDLLIARHKELVGIRGIEDHCVDGIGYIVIGKAGDVGSCAHLQESVRVIVGIETVAAEEIGILIGGVHHEDGSVEAIFIERLEGAVFIVCYLGPGGSVVDGLVNACGLGGGAKRTGYI